MKLALALAVATAASTHRAAADTSERAQVMITDGVSDALIASGLSERLDKATDAAPFIVGLVGAELGGPILHASHGEWGRAGLSLGSRALLPFVGFAVADRICDATRGERRDMLACLGVSILGGGVGLLGAEVIDWTALARGPQDPTAMPAVRLLSFGGHF